MSIYNTFDKLKELTTLTKIKNGYRKFIQTGQLELFDYGTGFIALDIYYHTDHNNNHYIRLWFNTIDDSDFGGWRIISSKEKAEKLIEDMSNNIFKNMIVFPTKDELNKLIQRYGIAVDYE